MSASLMTSEPAAGSNVPSRVTVVVLAAIVVVYIILRLPMLAVPLERDEGEYAYMGQLILSGELPYVAAYNMKLPGVYYAYALIMAAFGQTVGAIRFALIGITTLSTLLVFHLGRRWLDSTAGLLAAALFGLLSLSTTMTGFTANAEHFVVVFALLGLAALDETAAPAAAPRLLLGSLCLGLSLLMKQHGVVFCAFGSLMVLLNAGRNPRRIALRAVVVAAGVVTPYVLMAGYFATRGAFGPFWFWTVTYAREYTQQASFNVGLGDLRNTSLHILSRMWPVLALVVPGAWVVLASPSSFLRRAWLLGLLLAGFLATVPGLFFRPHYFLMMIPGVALTAAAGAGGLARWILQRAEAAPESTPSATTASKQTLVSALIGTAALLIAFGLESGMLLREPAELCRGVYFGNPFLESTEVARYLAAHTSPEDRIAVVGSEPQIYFYARRRAATGYIYMYPLMEEHPFAARMQKELIRDLETQQPKYLVFVSCSASWLRRPSSAPDVFEWMMATLQSNKYRIAGLVETLQDEDGQFSFEASWDNADPDHNPRAINHIVVLKRMAD